MPFTRIAAAVAALSTAEALAATASFDGFFSYGLTVSAPGATITVVQQADPGVSNFIDTFGTGRITTLSTSFDDSVDAATGDRTFTSSVTLSGEASDPDGFAEAFALSSVSLDITNHSAETVDATLDWSLEATADARTAPSPGFFADAGVLARVAVFAALDEAASTPTAIESVLVDTISGLTEDESVDADADRTFSIAHGETLLVDVAGAVGLPLAFGGAAFADVIPVPVSGSLGFALTGLAALGAARALRA